MKRVNYDLIAKQYDEPERDHGIDQHLVNFLEMHPELSSSCQSILDVGCGTGKQLTANKMKFPGMRMIGLDLSRGMLEIARKRCPEIHWIRGNGALLPFHSNSFIYVTNQFSYPHVRQREKMFREILRVLQPSGQFVLINIAPWKMQNWIVYKFFPSSWEIDIQDFLPTESICSELETIGFSNIHFHHDSKIIREEIHNFFQYASQRYHNSQFMSLPDKEYIAGLDHLKRLCLEAGEQKQMIDSEFCLVKVIAEKPGK